MIDSMSITDVTGYKFNFTIGESPPIQNYPVQSFETEVDTRNTRLNKAQAHGTWPAPTYMGVCTITVEGAIFGDTAQNFNQNLMALKNVCYPLPSQPARTNTKVGTLRIKPTGHVQLQTDVTLESFSCPLDGNLYANWQIIWISFDPFFIETVSNNPILY